MSSEIKIPCELGICEREFFKICCSDTVRVFTLRCWRKIHVNNFKSETEYPRSVHNKTKIKSAKIHVYMTATNTMPIVYKHKRKTTTIMIVVAFFLQIHTGVTANCIQGTSNK